ncbi:MAG TPA: DUF6519 domain-containing protein [Terracidiphilus sp.]|jgi:hypothetical protein|nr:DUF6519 domain-containing protein [Terracidiphilus sp.]
MKGDFSRIRFNPANQYTSVLKQQGRVDLDADANEQCFIDNSLRDRINTDVIGPYGGPEDNAGFAIQISANDILIGPGRYYVDGILVENPTTVSYDQQPWLVEPQYNASDLLQQLINGGQQGSLTFVLEVWQRMVTVLDDGCLQEPALGQADTTTRLQTVWRVVGTYNSSGTPSSAIGQNIGSADPPQGAVSQLTTCCQALYSNRLLYKFRGQMNAGLQSGGSGCGCQPIAAAGYQGLENQLYRVEIHQAGDLTSATFKWSRENASIVTAVNTIGATSPILTVASLGPDANLGFQPGQWVELTDDTYQFGDLPNQPGSLYQIVSTNPAALQVTLDRPVVGIDLRQSPRMRRWDQPNDGASNTGIPLSSSPIALENGIQVRFSEGDFQPGDYWTIPARTANGAIEWPPCESDGNPFQEPGFIAIHHAPVACVQLRAFVNDIFIKGVSGTAQNKTLVNDCRLLFPPLTAVNPDTVPPALHISAVSWTNDDIMTVDALLAGGLSVTLDQPTTCPWGGGNFQVVIEPPAPPGAFLSLLEGKLPGVTVPTFSSPAGTDCLLRTTWALDPPWGITVSGNQINWLNPVSSSGQVNYGAYEIYSVLNTLLSWQTPMGYGRIRVRLIGGAVFGAGANGNNIYLDGQAFGQAGARSLDNSENVALTLPSGENLSVSDFQGWFYLAPSVYVTSVVIQGVENGQTKVVTALKVVVNSQNQITALQIGETLTVPVTNLQALITLSYPPASPATVHLAFSPVSGTNHTSVVSIASSVQIPAGQQTFTTPINIVSNPGGGNTAVVTLNASVTVIETAYSVASPPQLSIAGMTPPAGPAPAPPFPITQFPGGDIKIMG